MKPADLRRVGWAEKWESVKGDRLAVYAALLDAGPRGATGSELAAKMGKSVLSVRPRLSELRNDYRLAAETNERRGGEHVFRAVDRERARVLYEMDNPPEQAHGVSHPPENIARPWKPAEAVASADQLRFF